MIIGHINLTLMAFQSYFLLPLGHVTTISLSMDPMHCSSRMTISGLMKKGGTPKDGRSPKLSFAFISSGDFFRSCPKPSFI